MYRRILAADVGSTTTKTVLFEKDVGGWKVTGKTVAPTTVEAPDLDVMIGLRSALRKLEARTGIALLEGARLTTPAGDSSGVDAFVATSSAGGGLQMLVTGLMKSMTAESAHRAALGAGAIVVDVISMDDSRMVVERLDRIRTLRPDMILVTGGTDGGNVSDVAAVAEYIAMANPEPRFGKDFKIPVIYAGNEDAKALVFDILKDSMDVTFTPNIRPVLEKEDLNPARAEIHRLFLEHVMMHAPGFKTLMAWAGQRVEPTPVAVGKVLSYLSQKRGHNVLGVDIGGATTDVFSVINGSFYRTVSANLGMSYSMANVMGEAKPESLIRWLPWDADENQVRNWNFNKMIRPTTLPQTVEDLLMEQAAAREALRLSLDHHKSLTRGLKGVRQQRDISDTFNQTPTGETLVKMMEIGTIIGSGGALSYAPRRNQAAMIMLDAFLPEGITDLMVDSQFLMPHLGVLMDVDMEAVEELLYKEALIPLGTSICPVGPALTPGTTVARVAVGGETHEIIYGELSVVEVREDGVGLKVTPRKDYDVGGGKGIEVTGTALKGVTGLILDGRGRPLRFPHGDKRSQSISRWYKAMSAYPEEALLARA